MESEEGRGKAELKDVQIGEFSYKASLVAVKNGGRNFCFPSSSRSCHTSSQAHGNCHLVQSLAKSASFLFAPKEK